MSHWAKSKEGWKVFGYNPLFLSDRHRLILGWDIHPANEDEALPGAFEQALRVTGHRPKHLLLDAGFFSHKLFLWAKESALVQMLCPRGKGGKVKRKSKGLHKQDFTYDERLDVYICPQGKRLKRRGGSSHNGRSYVEYRATAKLCTACTLWGTCTKAKSGRRIKRYEEDDLVTQQILLMSTPQAQNIYKQRMPSVEPLFSLLRGKLKVNRFLRRGLHNVRTEMGLYAFAINISRMLAFLCAFLLTQPQEPSRPHYA